MSKRWPAYDYVHRILSEAMRYPSNPSEKGLVYLVGPIEKDSQHNEWRTEAEAKLLEAGFAVINPARLESLLSAELGMELYNIHAMKEIDLDAFRHNFRWIIELDLGATKSSDALLVKLEGQSTSGTHHEVGLAFENGKPCVLVSGLPASEQPSWLLACTTGPVCKSIDEGVELLKEIYGP